MTEGFFFEYPKIGTRFDSILITLAVDKKNYEKAQKLIETHQYLGEPKVKDEFSHLPMPPLWINQDYGYRAIISPKNPERATKIY